MLTNIYKLLWGLPKQASPINFNVAVLFPLQSLSKILSRCLAESQQAEHLFQFRSVTCNYKLQNTIRMFRNKIFVISFLRRVLKLNFLHAFCDNLIFTF
jgi:hypothetical protein